MSKGRDIIDFLEDALDAMEKAERFISRLTKIDFWQKEFGLESTIRRRGSLMIQDKKK